MGATMVGEKCEFTMCAGTHGSTFGGNPVCASGGLVVMSRLTDEFLSEVTKKGEYIRTRLSKLAKVKSISGLGLMLGVETDDAVKVKNECLDNGLIVLTAKDKLRLLPALTITWEELDKGLEIMEKILG